jgi:hypothetical protein
MVVTQEMVERMCQEFLALRRPPQEHFLPEQLRSPLLDVKQAAKRAKEGFENTAAAERSASKNRDTYAGQSLPQLITQCQALCARLQTLNIVPDDNLLTPEHHWLTKYLPSLKDEYLKPLIKILSETYHYTDESERYLLAMTALILSYHSNPRLPTQQPKTFTALSAAWLQALLTFNCFEAPELASEIRGWHDRKFYSCHRNMLFMQHVAGLQLGINQQCLNLSSAVPPVQREQYREKYSRLVVTYDAIGKILPAVMADYEKMNSPALKEAVTRLQYVGDHASEFKDTPHLPPYTPAATACAASAPDNPADFAAAAAAVPPAYATADQTASQARGAALIQSGVRTLRLVTANPNELTPAEQAELDSMLEQVQREGGPAFLARTLGTMFAEAQGASSSAAGGTPPSSSKPRPGAP